jgi:hypothetical protein
MPIESRQPGLFKEKMMRQAIKRVALCVAAGAIVALLFSTVASAATVDHFALDSYHAWKKNHTPAARSEVKLKNKLYVAKVQGTFSYYGALNYVVPQAPWTTLCGTPEGSPEFGSAGGTGQVGFDSQFVFARPWTAEACAQAELPLQWINFQMKDGSGGGWAHPSVLNLESPDTPNPSHSYEYAVVGHKGRHVAFRLFDIRTRDNYGTLMITIRTAQPSDCSGTKYAAFGLSSEAECLAKI